MLKALFRNFIVLSTYLKTILIFLEHLKCFLTLGIRIISSCVAKKSLTLPIRLQIQCNCTIILPKKFRAMSLVVSMNSVLSIYLHKFSILIYLHLRRFINDKKGFVLGNDGVLLQYLG